MVKNVKTRVFDLIDSRPRFARYHIPKYNDDLGINLAAGDLIEIKNEKKHNIPSEILPKIYNER